MTDRRLLRPTARVASLFVLVSCFFAWSAAACSAHDDGKPAAPAAGTDAEVKTTASGLSYQILTPGKEGDRPKFGDKVKVHYTGWLVNGTKFDSSRDRGEPTEFTIGGVIPGWNEALVLMTKGARWKLTIPPNLAYGASGSPPLIPANATLIFDVELLDFQSAPKMPEFHQPDPKAQKTTASGLKYEVLAEGSGDQPGANDYVEMKFAFWNDKGELVDCTEKSGVVIKGLPGDLALAFMKEGIPLLRPGARYRFEVPPALCFKDKSPVPQCAPNSVTFWDLELTRTLKPLPTPPFAMPDEEKSKTTPSGLKYEVVEPGEGDSPRVADHLKVEYAGWLADGTLFDSSFSRGEPASMQLGGVIPGWNEVLQLMKPGAVYRFVLPPALAYGARAHGPKIPANSTLVFYLKLVKVGE